MMKRCILVMMITTGLVAAQTILWQEVIPSGLPEGARLFAGQRPQPALRAWYIDADLSNPGVAVRSYLSSIAAKKEPVPGFTQRVGAHAAVNGGYFSTLDGASYSAVVYPGQVVAQNVSALNRDGKIYPVTRSLFSLNQDRVPAVDWIYHFGGRPADIYRFTAPIANLPGTPAAAPLASQGTPFDDILTGIGGGPTLLKNGVPLISYDEEVFWGSGVGDANRDPRTAVGYTGDHHVILMVVDGRQPASEGATLAELAAMLRDLGCVEAMNLDGGGSSQMSVAGSLVNRPEGQTTGVRAVPTILAVVHSDSLIARQKTVYFEKVIDSADPECTLLGTGWFESANPGYHGTTRSLLNTPGQGGKYAQFQPRLRGPADYEIQGWWVAASNRCLDTPFIIHHQGMSDTVRVNQSVNGSAWIKIGAFRFDDDGSEYIRIADAATRGQYIVVDAIRILSYDAMTPIAPLPSENLPEPALLRSYPNPFNARTRLQYCVRQPGRIQLWLYDRLGRKVLCLADAWHDSGVYHRPLSAADLSSGLYFCVLHDEHGARAVEKLLLVR